MNVPENLSPLGVLKVGQGRSGRDVSELVGV